MLERTYLAPADVEREEPRARLAAFSFAVE